MSKLDIQSAHIIKPKIFEDSRGVFFELWKEDYDPQDAYHLKYVQDNLSVSKRRGTLRGLHFQWPCPQAKLLTVLRGSILDVVVDLRMDSDNYKQVQFFELSSQNANQIFVPEGFAHGFLTLEDDVLIHYKCSDFYRPEHEKTIHYQDPELNIAWPELGLEFILSPKDAMGKSLKDFHKTDFPRSKGVT